MPSVNNPILKGFNPDPSICRAGDDFYIVDDLQVLVLDEDTGLVHFESGKEGVIETMVVDLFEVDGLMRFTKTSASPAHTSLLKAY